MADEVPVDDHDGGWRGGVLTRWLSRSRSSEAAECGQSARAEGSGAEKLLNTLEMTKFQK